MRRCKRCQQEKPLTEFYTYGSKAGKRYHRWQCITCENKRSREYHKANRDRNLKRSRAFTLARYGLSPEQYDEILFSQGGGCAICGSPPTPTKALAADHDHTCCPGKRSCGKCFRGLLCTSCNNGLGRFSDNAELLRKAANYLETGMVYDRSP